MRILARKVCDIYGINAGFKFKKVYVEMNYVRYFAVFLFAIVVTPACTFTQDNGVATLDLKITDGPIKGSAESVVVQFSGVEIKPKEGDTLVFEVETTSIDLLDLPGSVSAYLLKGVELQPGEYIWINLLVDAEDGVDDSYIDILSGAEVQRHDLTIPSGSESGLKIRHGFTVASGDKTNFTIDFDLRKSIVSNVAGTEFKLKPVLRLVDDNEVGHIRGEVSSSYLAATDCVDKGVVYAYEGHDADLIDVSSEDGPIAFSNVGIGQLTNTYEVGFLPLGDYTIAHTCDASLDDPELADDAMEFNSAQNVTVEVVNQAVKADFE
jgi:hypothetical protein